MKFLNDVHTKAVTEAMMRGLDEATMALSLIHEERRDQVPPAAHGRSRGWGWRLLNRYKTKNGKLYQLHATRGWKCIGRAA